MAAFQALGPFISTFADPAISGIQVIYNADGSVQIASVEDMEVDESARTSTEVHLSHDVETEPEMRMESGVTRVEKEKEEKEYEGVGKLEVSLGKEEEEEFNSFVFWRNPVPVIDVDSGSSDGSDAESGGGGDATGGTASNTQLSLPMGQNGDSSTTTPQQESALPDSGISSPVVSPDTPTDKNSAQDIPSSQESTVGNQDGVVHDASEVVLQNTENEQTEGDVNELVNSVSNVDLNEAGTPPEKPERTELSANGEENGNKVLKAAVNEANDLTETAPHISSTGVIDQRLDQKNLTFVNGIVEEEVATWSGQVNSEENEEEEAVRFQVGFRTTDIKYRGPTQ